MSNLKLVRHQLVCMLPVSFSKVHMKKDTVTNRQASVNSINQKEYPSETDPPHIRNTYSGVISDDSIEHERASS